MKASEPSSDVIRATISGPVSGQVAVGKDITQTADAPRPLVTEAERATLGQMLVALEARVAVEVPPEKKEAALERLAELAEAINASEPDLTTLAYVRRWFGKHLPELAGAVAAVVVHPIVGKLVDAAGETLAAEFRRRFADG